MPYFYRSNEGKAWPRYTVNVGTSDMKRAKLRLWYDLLLARIDEAMGSYNVDVYEHNRTMRYVFVVSTGRTGTKMLARVFNDQVKNTLSFHEPSPDINELGLSYLSGRSSNRTVRSLFNHYRYCTIHNCRKSEVGYYVESNNLLSYFIPFIQEHFPNRRIIHVNRDGMETIASLYSKLVKKRNGEAVHAFDDEDPRSRITPHVLGEKNPPKQWSSMDRFEKICYYWTRKEALIRKHIQEDDRAMTFPYRGLIADPQENTWRSLLEFIEAEGTPSSIVEVLKSGRSNQNKEDLFGMSGGWTSERQKIFERYRSILDPYL